MLMTVLRGELAVKQSKALIRTFRAMKDYIVENRSIAGQEAFRDAGESGAHALMNSFRVELPICLLFHVISP